MKFEAFTWGRGIVVATACAATLSAGLVTPAVADPSGQPITIHCDELGTFDVVVSGNGPAVPGHVVGSTQLGIPYAIRIVGTFTPSGGEPVPILDEYARPAPPNGRLDHCAFHQEGADESGSFEIDFDVWLSYTPSN